VVSLRNLGPQDSRAYLQARGVPPAHHARVVDFTRGHPLALSLLADLLLKREPDVTPAEFRPEQAPDVVRTLLERFVDRVPSRSHWQALAVCAHARVTTEALLAQVLEAAHAPALFDWLRGLPFVETGPQGIFPHDLARDVLDTDLRWRDPQTYARLHARIRDSLVARLQASRGLEQQALYFDFIYLVRHSPVSRPYYDWASFGQLYAESAAPADHAEIVALARQHEGEASARICAYWLERQPQAFVVFRAAGAPQTTACGGVTPTPRSRGDPAGRPIAGFCAALLLDGVTSADLATDPAIAAAWRFVLRHGPLRPGERFMHHRFFVGRDAYQDPATHNMVALVATMRWLTTPRLAWCFPVVADPEHWRPMFESIRFPRAPEADFEVGGRRYGAFVHDWRADPPAVWVEAKAALEPPPPPGPADGQPGPGPLLVLSEPDFQQAVRQALRDYRRPAELATNPLLRSRLVRAAGDGASPVATLQALIRDAAEALGAHPKTDKLRRAVVETYLEPAPTQELAAERLGLPFNTYRYQLSGGIREITRSLWQRELRAGLDADSDSD
jgi:hypothetical protein